MSGGGQHAVCYVEEGQQDAVEEPIIYTRGYSGNITLDGISPTLEARAGTGGNNQPIIAYTYDARGNGDGKTCNTITGDHENRITDYTSVVVEPTPIHDMATRFSGKRGDKADGKGNGLGIGAPGDPMNTLTSGDRHAVAYLASGKDSTGTLMANAGSKMWLGNQEAFSGDYHIIEEQSATVAYSLDEKMGQTYTWEEQANTLAARDYKQPQAVCYADPPRYIVRRLTPTECARLQGFADGWGHIEKKDSLTDEEYKFWLEVRNTHAAINGKKVQDYTEKQMLTWYNKLWTDSAEYKMWGNGIALPPALYCLQGIVDVLSKPEEDPDDWMS